ncbi:Nif3-like dinuclear metal center hexameric protein [Planctomycetota bacterium]
MAVKRDELVRELNALLDIANIKDASCNGLQVQGAAEVTRVGLTVDACLEAYKQAGDKDCQMLLVHHGLIWGGIKAVTGRDHDHVKHLLNAGLNLYAAHLPLDLHPEYGNNIGLARLLNLDNIQPFGMYENILIGHKGELSEALSTAALSDLLKKELEADPVCFDFGTDLNTTVGIVSGGGAGELKDAIDLGIDCFITGESAHWNYHAAQEAGVNVIYSGHYHTETIGVKALGKYIEETFGIETVFIDLPTPI